MRTKGLINLFSVVILSLISLTYIHEIGHAFFAKLNGCETKSLIFDNGLTSYTLVACEKNNDILIILGGLIFTLVFSLVFLTFGKEFYILSLSISFLLALEDLSFFVSTYYIIIFSSILSFFGYLRFFENVNKKKYK
ncbi:MAG: M50 family metallopeptidase [Candidatus Aenigmatarchaeota archaeon]